MTPLKERTTRRGRVVLPAVACVDVAVLLGAADDEVFGPPAVGGSGAGSCVPPTPLTHGSSASWHASR